ncbi:hypothetical protein EVAR_82734_1 [Eumeta japonica]|uniref:Uncharacterized protein n=1 Tax=Eumeta variegata TaxID=151549 RepID=A0A4C1ZM33_EUMVA|nr:hypothetical protein EVAR_82734_1 [Eumeta japonica]
MCRIHRSQEEFMRTSYFVPCHHNLYKFPAPSFGKVVHVCLHSALHTADQLGNTHSPVERGAGGAPRVRRPRGKQDRSVRNAFEYFQMRAIAAQRLRALISHQQIPGSILDTGELAMSLKLNLKLLAPRFD